MDQTVYMTAFKDELEKMALSSKFLRKASLRSSLRYINNIFNKPAYLDKLDRQSEVFARRASQVFEKEKFGPSFDLKKYLNTTG